MRRLLPARLWHRATRDDLVAGVVLGVESVPDGLAAGLLAGVNPVLGLHGYLVGTAVGAVATSSVFMTVQATGAMAVIIADVPAVQEGPSAGTALFTLAVMTGLVMLALGLLRLGGLVRFVPNAVLTGFVNAVAVSIVLGQLGAFTGYSSDAGNRVVRAVDTALNVGSFDLATVVVGVTTIGLILLLERTRVGALGLVVAVVATSAATAVLGLGTVARLDDIATIPGSLPRPVLPSPGLAAGLVLPALALALVGLVQGAAISSSVPNPDGRYPDPSGDFRGQGLANVAAGLFQGMPVGGSMSATALVRTAGARSRLANLVAAAVMAAVVLLLGGAVGAIAMPALAALLVLVGIRTVRWQNVVMAWRTGPTQAAVVGTTFVLTLLVPLQYAVLMGVGLSVVLHVAQQSSGVRVVQWSFDPAGGFPREVPPPRELAADRTVVLQPYGSLFFAAAPVFESQLPRVTPASSGAAVVLRLRGEQELGSTFIQVVSRYAAGLQAVGGRLLLVGVGPRVMDQLRVTGVLSALGPGSVHPADDRLLTSVGEAVQEVERWRSGR